MDQLNCGCRSVQNLLGHTQALSGSVYQQRADALTAIEYRVTHGVVKSLWRQRRRRQDRI
jgi:hypothetical protein